MSFFQFTDLTRDALHVHLSLLAFLALVMLARRRPATAWLLVLALELLNEVGDYFSPWRRADWVEQSVHDILNTMFWPTVLVLLVRFKQLKLR